MRPRIQTSAVGDLYSVTLNAYFVSGGDVTLVFVARNNGPSAAPRSIFTDLLSSSLVNCRVSCSGATGGASCVVAATPFSGGNVTQVVNLPAQSSTTITVHCKATCAAVDAHLPAGSTTVGTRVEFDHTRATPVGDEVTAEAELVAVDGRRLTFRVVVRDTSGEVGSGVVHRAVVDRDRFHEGVRRSAG